MSSSMLSGILNINKPHGLTSFQVVAAVRRLTRARKIYCARIVLGATTDTYDSEGQFLTTADPSGISREQVEEVLRGFRGDIDQIPPMHSALKHQGQRLYELARAGLEVERKPRRGKIHDIELVQWEPPALVIQVQCGK